MDATDRPDQPADQPVDQPSEQPSGQDGPDAGHVASRSELLPEEQEAGSADPHAQAEAILADSQERTEDPEGTRDESTQTPG